MKQHKEGHPCSARSSQLAFQNGGSHFSFTKFHIFPHQQGQLDCSVMFREVAGDAAGKIARNNGPSQSLQAPSLGERRRKRKKQFWDIPAFSRAQEKSSHPTRNVNSSATKCQDTWDDNNRRAEKLLKVEEGVQYRVWRRQKIQGPLTQQQGYKVTTVEASGQC